MLEVGKTLIVLVVPCFNEELRWNAVYWRHISQIPNLQLIFVNDGSSDQTHICLQEIIIGTSNAVLHLENNVGKAEAIRLGLREAIKSRPAIVGFIDADGAFSEMDVVKHLELQKSFSINEPFSIWSSRIKMAGRNIERKAFRHYIARLLLTFLSIYFRFSIYDTQSGLKTFVATKEFYGILDEKFKTRWFVDLEILFRYRIKYKCDLRVREEPLEEWKDIENSKLNWFQVLYIVKDLCGLLSYKRL